MATKKKKEHWLKKYPVGTWFNGKKHTVSKAAGDFNCSSRSFVAYMYTKAKTLNKRVEIISNGEDSFTIKAYALKEKDVA
jgi:hypothetical protein